MKVQIIVKSIIRFGEVKDRPARTKNHKIQLNSKQQFSNKSTWSIFLELLKKPPTPKPKKATVIKSTIPG